MRRMYEIFFLEIFTNFKDKFQNLDEEDFF
jgi:hypothetical protein